MEPKLRFKEFTDEWKEKKLGDIAEEFIGGGTPSTKVSEYWNGDIPWIQSSDINKDNGKVNVEKYISDEALKNSAAKLVPSSSIAVVTRVGVGKVALLNHKYSTSQDFLSFVNIYGDSQYWFYEISKLMYKQSFYLQGTSIKGITKSEILNINTYCPSLPEQEKIGKFFCLLDQRIEKQERKVELLEEEKKGYMQKIFNQEIRFKGNYPDWNCNEIKNLISTISSKSYMTQKVEIDGQYPIYQQGDNSLFGYSNKCPYMDYSKCLLFGDHTLSLYKPQKPFLVSTDGIKIITFETMNRDFSYYMLQYYMPKSQGYKRHFSILKERIVFFSSLPEQEKIGNFFSLLDKRIEKEKEKLQLMKQQKKGLLQQMFV